MSIESDLATLRRDAEVARRRYLQTVAEIDAKKLVLADARAALAALGCATVADAESRIADLEAQLEAQLDQIKALLA